MARIAQLHPFQDGPAKISCHRCIRKAAQRRPVQKQDATRPFLYTKEKMTTNVVAFRSQFHAWSDGLSFYPSISNSSQQHSLLVGSPGLARALTPAAQNQMTHASTEGLGPAWTVATTATLSRVVFPGARRPGAWERGWVAAPCWPTRGRDTWNGFFGAFVRVIRCVCGGGGSDFRI